jgi:hypothetical protein
MHGNEYQAHYPQFEQTPKAVLAAVAYSLAMRLSEDNPATAESLLEQEWRALYECGIVLQKPR